MRKLMKHIATLAVLLTSVSSFGQSIFWASTDSTYQRFTNFILLDAHAEYRSNTLTNEYVDRMVFGGYYGPEAKAQVEKKLVDMNRVGGQLNGNLSYWNMSDSLFSRPNLGMKIFVESNYLTGATFSNELYRLIFNGNKSFAGQTMNFDGTSGEFYAYQKLGLGVFDKQTLSGVSISYVNGQDYLQSYVNKGALYTSELGDSLHLDYNGIVSESFSNGTWWAGDGSGAAMDVQVNFPLTEGKGVIHMEVRDLGFVYWNQMNTYTADSSASFTGIDLNDLLDDQSSFDTSELLDTLVYDTVTSAELKMLPLTLGVQMFHQTGKRGMLELGLRIRPTRAFVPEFTARYHYKMLPLTWISASATFGGYGGFRVGAAIQKVWNGWYLSAGSDDLPGLIMRKSRGRGAYLSVGLLFGK
ncbi:MAG: hypothetical protein KDC12_07490 [Flavobacteriales bacterium]|nr:hypothetical protein [Flavobacteriales bacterium]